MSSDSFFLLIVIVLYTASYGVIESQAKLKCNSYGLGYGGTHLSLQSYCTQGTARFPVIKPEAE